MGSFKTHGAGKAHFGPGQLLDPDEPRQDQVGDPQEVFHLHFIDFVVPADQDRHRPVLGLIDQGLDDVGGHDLEKGRHFLHGAHVGGGHRLRSVAHRRTGLARRQCHLGLLQVGGIVATGAGGQQVLAGVRQDHEFVGKAAADGAGIRLHHLEGQAAAAEDAVVGVVHPAVAGLGAGFIGVKAVGVLHDEFPPPDQSEAGPDLIPKLHLDLVEIEGQLPVGMHFFAHQVGDHFLMGGPETAVPAVAVLEAQQFLAVNLPAAGLLPQLRRLHRGHQHLLGPGPVHLLPDDPLHLAEDPQTQGQIIIDPRGQLANHPGPEQQTVRNRLGLRRVFFQSRYQQSRKQHRHPN